METFEIHSITDLITNSSTTIYTYSDKSPAALRPLINEIFDIFGVKERCDDVFAINVMYDTSRYDDAVDGYEGDIPDEYLTQNDLRREALVMLVNNIKSGKVDKPKWFVDMENNIRDSWGGTKLYITAKDPKYDNLAKLVVKFLYSTYAEECDC